MQPIYRANSQDTSRYTLAPLNFIEVLLHVDRRNGEFFPAFEGEFLRVERADMPCFASVVTNDRTQVFCLADGLEIQAPFKGLTLFHDNYNLGSDDTPVLRIVTSKVAVVQNNLPNSYANRLPLPYSQSSTLGVGGALRYTTIVPRQARAIRKLRVTGTVVLTAALTGDIFAILGFQAPVASGPLDFLTGGLLTRSNPDGVSVYSPSTECPQSDVVTPSIQLIGANTYRVSAVFENVPVPFAASIVNAAFSFGDNVSAVNVVGAVGTGLNVYYE